MAYEPPSNDYYDPRLQHSVDQNQFESQKSRPRAPSSIAHGDGIMPDIPRYIQPHQPLNEAVTSAVSNADASHYVPPEVIAQIAATVISQLKNTGLDGTTPTPTSYTNIPPHPPPHSQVQEPIPLSPTSVSASSQSMFSQHAHTPPSPYKYSDHSNHGSPPPQFAFAQPPPTSPPPNVPSYDRRTSSPLSQNSESGYTRPKGPTRLSTSREETTLEKIWGQLFDEDGNSTTRLSQFLRGLAVHIVCRLVSKI